MPRKVSFVLFVIGISYFAFIAIGLTIEGRWAQLIPVEESLVIAALLMVIFSFRIRDFYYDDRYEIFTVRNPRILLPFYEKPNKYNFELPKGQIKGYKIINRLIYKKLTVYFASYHGEYKIKHFHLYFISGKTFDAIIANLERLVAQNNPD